MRTIARKEAKKVLYKNAEKKIKWMQVDEASMTSLTQLYVYDPLDITQGATTDCRVGNEIRLGGIHLKGVLNSNASITTFVRMAVIKTTDENNIGTATNLFDGAQGGNMPITSAPGLNAIYYPLDKTRYQVVYQRTFRLAPTSTVDAGDATFFSKWIKLNNVKIEYQGAGTGADNVKPRYHIMFIVADANDDTGLGNTVELSLMCRTYFTDI